MEESSAVTSENNNSNSSEKSEVFLKMEESTACVDEENGSYSVRGEEIFLKMENFATCFNSEKSSNKVNKLEKISLEAKNAVRFPYDKKSRTENGHPEENSLKLGDLAGGNISNDNGEQEELLLEDFSSWSDEENCSSNAEPPGILQLIDSLEAIVDSLG